MKIKEKKEEEKEKKKMIYKEKNKRDGVVRWEIVFSPFAPTTKAHGLWTLFVWPGHVTHMRRTMCDQATTAVVPSIIQVCYR